MSIRILALVNDGFRGVGGIAQYNRDLFTAWSTLDCVDRVDVLPRVASGTEHPLPAKVFEHAPVASPWLYSIRAIGRVLRAIPCDAVFCGHLHLTPVASVVARLADVPLWVQIHGIEAWRAPRALIRRAAERADVVTAVSRHTRRRFLAWADVEPHRVPVLPNTMGDEFGIHIDRSRAKQTLGLAGRRVVLSVSRLAKSEGYKGHDRIIRSLPGVREILGDVLYVIAGDGDLRPVLEEQVYRAGLEDAVRFVGRVENGDLPTLYRAADVFAMPSVGEGFGIVYLEAMACGTPVVAGGDDGARDPLQDGRLGILSDDESLACDLVRLLDTRASAQEVERYERRLSASAGRHFGRHVFSELVGRTTENLAHGVGADRPAGS